MDLGVGLPAAIPEVEGSVLLEWACRAEHHGFSTLGVLDRLVYDNYEPIVALAAAAAVTRRIRLATTVLISPYRGTPAVLAKQLATLHHLSGAAPSRGRGRGRPRGRLHRGRHPVRRPGPRLEEQLAELRRIWTGDGRAGRIGPHPPGGGPVLLVGGHSAAAIRRAARYGQGWIAGAGSATPLADRLERVRAAWDRRAGRCDRPRLMALAYVALGPRAHDRAARLTCGTTTPSSAARLRARC